MNDPTIAVVVACCIAAAVIIVGSALREATRTIDAAPRVTTAQERAETNLRLREIAAHEWPTDPNPPGDPVMTGPWRKPAEATENYPGLWVHDSVRSGSITFGQTRLPLWAPQWQIADFDEYVHPTEEPAAEWQTTAEAMIHHLLLVRGDFARLVLALADAERHDQEQADADLTVAWWYDPEARAPVVDLLRRCLTALGEEP